MVVEPFLIEANAQRVALCGELDIGTAPELERRLQGLSGDVVLECHQLKFIDAAGLSILVRTQNRLAAENGQLLIDGLSAACRRVFEICRLDQFLRLLP
jgi:anti-anti-sigma factor